MDKNLPFGLFLISFGLVFGQDCNQLNECLMQFTQSFSGLQENMQDPDKLKNVCSDKDTALSELKECQKKVTGNDDQACAQQIAMQDMQAEMMVGMLNKMICEPEPECSMMNMFQCYGDFLKGFGIESMETLDDLSKAMKLTKLEPKDIDHENFCKYTVNADEEEIAKCFEEKTQQLSQCIGGGPGGPGGPGEGGAHPEGGAFPEGMDPSMFEPPEGEMPEGYPGGEMPEGYPDGGAEEENGMEGGMFPSLNFDMQSLANASVICEPGCENFFQTQEDIENFTVKDNLIQDANSAENGTEEFTDACGKLDEALKEGTDAAGECELQQGIVTHKVESNQELKAAIEKCALTLEFKSGTTSIVVSFHVLLLGLVLLML